MGQIWRSLMPLVALGVVLPGMAQSQVSLTTYRNNLARSGENLQETILTPLNVTPVQFGKIFSHPVDGQVYAQPLYLPSVSIPGKGIHNMVFVATAHDTVYAFDADSIDGLNASPLWQVNLADANTGERPANVSDVLGCNSMIPEIGITSTPVIDTATGTLYVVALTIRRDSFVHQLHALDIRTGAERPGSPVVIDAVVPGTGDFFSASGLVPFHPYLQKNRAGLLLLNNVVYTAWTSYCDFGPNHGWLIGHDAKTLRQTAVFNSSPNAWAGSFWMGGAAPAADSEGNIYLISANGPFDADKKGSAFGDTFLKLSSADGLAIADYFTPHNQADLNRADMDLGAGGAVLLPDSVGNSVHRHLLISAGKEGRIFLLDRDQMGHFNGDGDSQIVQSLEGAIGPFYGGPAYFNQTVYFSAANDTLKAFSISAGRLSTSPSARASQVFGYPGAVPTVSANGSSDGIVWLLEGRSGGTLHAYDASNVANELYNSQMKGSRDSLGSFVRFTVPTVANGKVYVGTANSVAVFGLLNQPPQPSLLSVVNAASLQPGPVAPGSIISIFGHNLAQSSSSCAEFCSTLAGVILSINGIPAPLQFVSPEQINAQVPFEVTAGPATAELRLPAMSPSAIPFAVAPVAPGIFANGPNQGAVRNADGGVNTPDNPAAVGSFVTVYLTGQGPVQPPVATGAPAPVDPLAQAVYPVTATIGGSPAEVITGALSPGSVGLFEVKLRLPLIGSGSYSLQVSVNGVSSSVRLITVSEGR
jgi:uncharacterized protein (TIGR03437 family)